jgi:hypothetical protein
MFLRLAGLLSALVLAACAAQDVKYAPPEAVAAARYVHPGPPSITLFTVVSTRSGAGAHSGLLINGSERLMFDPAGTWYHPRLPEQHDVHFGMTPRMVSFYIDYHARETYDVVEQTIVVTPEQAAAAIARARAYGAVPKAQCARSVSAILRGVPGFEGLPSTWYPKKLSAAFGALPGVTAKRMSDDDTDDNHGVLLVQAQADPDED